MAKCLRCNKKLKLARNCPALNEIICPACCGSKRGLDIQCKDECKYFIESKIKENKKQIKQIVKESFNREEEDIYQDERLLRLVAPFEQFIFQNYYGDKNITDDFITDCYTKIYYTLDGKGSIFNFNEAEMKIYNEFNRVAKKTKIPVESQKLILLRMMKSVDNMTGGMFGNKMYLELLRNHFTGTGIVAEVMEKLK